MLLFVREFSTTLCPLSLFCQWQINPNALICAFDLYDKMEKDFVPYGIDQLPAVQPGFTQFLCDVHKLDLLVL